MKKVSYTGPRSMHFEGFPEKCERSSERSSESSLIFLPNQQKLISDGEYDHIVEAYPHEVRYLRCQKLPSEERVVLGKRKGQANSAKPRDPKKAKQFDGNKLHIAANKIKSVKSKKGGKGKTFKKAAPEVVEAEKSTHSDKGTRKK